jgi:hypothetical protein
MKINKYTVRELKLTAILYTTRSDVVEHVASTGKLPAKIPLGGFPTAMNYILKCRGLDSLLSETENLVFEAIERDKLLPGGGVILVEERFPIYSVEAGQHIEICPGPRDMDWEDE